MSDSDEISPASAVDGDRLWRRHMELAQIGATGRGGVNRQALSPEDGRARAMLLGWAQARGFTGSIDPIGNLFIRRPGKDSAAANTADPIVVGWKRDPSSLVQTTRSIGRLVARPRSDIASSASSPARTP